MKQEFKLSPIGAIRTGQDGFRLEIKEEYRPALKGLEGFSYVNVLWWCHLLDSQEYRQVVECEQPYKNSPAQLGVFDTLACPAQPHRAHGCGCLAH